MAAPINSQSQIMGARAMTFQLASSAVATIPWALKIKNAHPLTAGIAAQVVMTIIRIAAQRFPKRPSSFIFWSVFVSTFSAAYISASRLDKRVQALFFLLFLMDDVRVIGPKNIWNEVTAPSPKGEGF